MFILDAIISLALIYIILQYVGLDEFLKEVSSIKLVELGLSVLFLLIMFLGMSLRIRMLLSHFGTPLSFIDILRAHWVGMLLADFTPARSGYLAVAGILHTKHKIPLNKATLAILGPQMLDFIAKVVAGSAAIVLLLGNFIRDDSSSWILFAGAGVMSIGVIVVLLLLFSKPFLNLFSFAKKLPLADKIYGIFEHMQADSHLVLSKLPQLLGILIITWSAKAFSWYFVAKSLGITLNLGFPEPLFYFLFQPLITIVEFMPLPTIAGLGFSEGASIAVFGAYGVIHAKAAAFGLLARFKTTAVNLIAIPDALDAIKRIKL